MTLPFNFNKAIAGLTKVKLPGGVVGRVTLLVSVVSICITVITCSANSKILSACAVGGILLLASVISLRLINFADRNPQAALLEGSEFIIHEQIVHASKYLPSIPKELAVHESAEPMEALEDLQRIPDVPEQEVQQIKNGGEK